MNEDSVFAVALEQKSPAEREAYLNEACGDNAELKEQVEALLRASADAGSFLDHPPADLDVTIQGGDTDRDTGSGAPMGVSLAFLEPCETPGRLGKLGQYEIIEVVGQGGMGAVLRAFEIKLSRVVAVKVMSPELAANPTAVKRFLREAQSAASVVHDHVVTIHAIADEHRPPYLVMEFIKGQTLQQKIDREGTLNIKQILRIGSQMAAGLAAAHKLGLIHRDVKPGNILLENGVERVKITDFGLARAADDMEMTKTGQIAGTPQYMSPEQARGEPIDTRSDLFSLGSVLYAMCAGRPAFRAETTWAVLRRVCDDAPRPIREVNPEIPLWLEAIVEDLLAKQPGERFQTAAEVSDLLARHLAHVQSPATNPQPDPLVSAADRLERPVEGKLVARKPAPFRWLAPVAVLVATLVVLLVGLAISEAAGVTKLAATIIRISSGEGTIVVKVDDPLVKVTIDGQDLVFTEAGAQEIRVRPGEHRILASKAGQSVPADPRIVSISRGGREVVNVTFETFKAKRQPVEQPKPHSEWKSLFNGKDLSGWKTHPDEPGNWRVINEELVGSGQPCNLFSEKGDYEDFHLRLKVKVGKGEDSGVFFRAPFEFLPGQLPYEAHIQGDQERPGSGALWGYADSAESTKVPPADEWFELKILAQGNRLVIMVNGQTSVDYIDSKNTYARGHLALQHLIPGSTVHFKKIEIQELPPTTDATNHALHFDGKTSSVAIPTLKREGAGPMTVETWVRPAGFGPAPFSRVFSFGIGASRITLDQQQVSWAAEDRLSGRLIHQSVKPGKLTHLAFVIDAEELRFYVDGLLGARQPRQRVGEQQPTQGHAWIGTAIHAHKLLPEQRYVGLIDELRVSKKARYDKDFVPAARFEPDADTLAHYHFDEGQGAILNDSSGNAHHGQIKGATWVRADGSKVTAPASTNAGLDAKQAD